MKKEMKEIKLDFFCSIFTNEKDANLIQSKIDSTLMLANLLGYRTEIGFKHETYMGTAHYYIRIFESNHVVPTISINLFRFHDNSLRKVSVSINQRLSYTSNEHSLDYLFDGVTKAIK